MADTKTAEFTLRIAGKRQITLPERILKALGLEKGDEFRLVMRDPSDIRLIPCTRIRRDLITPEIEEILRKRRAEIEAGIEMTSQEDLLKESAAKRTKQRFQRPAKLRGKAAIGRVKSAVRKDRREIA